MSQIFIVTLLSYQLEERYVYGVYPLFFLLAIYSMICLTEIIGNKLQVMINELMPLKKVTLISSLIIIIINLQPIKVLAGYLEAINRSNTQIFEYIHQYKTPEDIIISPTPPFAAINLGGLDYFLMGTDYLDAIYWHYGKLIDRWGGGVVVSNINQINQILAKSQPVWIHIDDIRIGKFDSKTWEYIETLGKPIIDRFGTRLQLWQPEDGLPKLIPNQGKDLGAY